MYALVHWIIALYTLSLQEMSTIPLSQFLLENEGKRCVVVIDVRSQRLVVLSRKT